MSTDTYRVTGMTCQHCVAAVSEEITAIPGVTAVDVVLVEGGTSTVTVHSTAPLDLHVVAAAAEEAGYALAGPCDLPLA